MVKTIEQPYRATINERKTIYKFLRVGFEAPLTLEILKVWQENFSHEFIEVLTVNNEELRLFFQSLENKDLKVIEKEEKDAYLATFSVFNDTGHIPAPPWESVYVTRDNSMFGEPVFQIRNQLESFGLEFTKKSKEPEDHISIELEFMTYLIDYTFKALQAQNKEQYLKGVYVQYWLHKEHFNRWINQFTTDILSSNTSNFYKGLAKLLNHFIEEDFEYIKSIKEDLDNE